MSFIKKVLLFASLLLIVSTSATCAQIINLQPGMSALTIPGVPALYDSVPDADITKPGAAIEPEKAYSWLKNTGEPFATTTKLSGKEDRAVLTVWDWENRPVAQEKLSSPETQFQFNTAGRGTYMLTLDGFQADKCIYRLVRSFSVCPSNVERRKLWAEDEFFVGTCSFPARQNWSNKYGFGYPPGLTPEQSWKMDLDMTARSGLQVVRLDVIATDKETNNSWVDTATTDPIMKEYASRGLKLDLQLWGPNVILPKYGNPADAWRYPKQEQPFRSYISESAKRYGKYAWFIEIGNEPDNLDFWKGTPEEYIAQHKWAVEEIRKSAPKAVIANGGFCLVKPEWTPIMATGIRGTVDLVAYHSHGGLTDVKKTFASVVKVLKDTGYKSPKLINTEMGYAAWRLDQERSQATSAIQKTIYFWAHGNKGVLLYLSRGIGGPRIVPEDPDWGFVDYFMCPRFAYGALSAFIDTYAGAHFARTLIEEDNLHAYLFKSKTKQLISLFTTGDPANITLTGKWKSAAVIDPMGNRKTVTSTLSIKQIAGNYPITIELVGGKDIRVNKD